MTSAPARHSASPDRTQTEAARLALAVSRVSRWIRRQNTFPIGHGAISALATIARLGPLRLGDLATLEGVAPASLSRMVAALVTDGYVDRLADPADGRSSLVRTTVAGDLLLSELRESSAMVLLDRLDKLDPGQRTAILAALPALEALATDT